MACSGLFCFLQITKLQSVLNCKIIKNEPHALCYSKMEQLLLQRGEALEHYKVGPVLLQSRAGITKWGNFYHKMAQLLQSSAIQ